MHKHLPPDQRGYSLIEALVALLITSVSLLGMAGLQLNGVRNTNSSSQRVEATTLAYDMLERMRANRRQATLGDYDIDIGDVATGVDTAGQDLQAWKNTLALLPEGDGSITVDAEQATITVQWNDAVSDDGDADATARVHLRSEL